jgi:glycerol-3-phosphate dehydrogenase (NAD(P)+)
VVDTSKVAVIGAGSWGTVMAGLLAGQARQAAAGEAGPWRTVALWARDPARAGVLARERVNNDYLPGFRLPGDLAVTGSLEEAVDGAGVLVMAVPSCWARRVMLAAGPAAGREAVVVNLAKGIEPQTLLTMSQVAAAALPGRPRAVLTGPNFAAEIAMGLPAATVVASGDKQLAACLQRLFSLPHLRVYTNDDVIGCEVAGSVKNVLALGAGMADGLGAGDNARAAIVTRGVAELSRLGVAMGGDPLTFSGLAGLGDIVLTCTSERSRNRRVGFLLGTGRSLEDVLAGMGQVAEGVTTAASVVALAHRHHVELPICEQVAAVLAGRIRPSGALAALLGREPTHELAGLRTPPVDRAAPVRPAGGAVASVRP